MQYIGDTIRKYRKENGLSLRKMAELLDVSFAYISYIENGKMTPSSFVIDKLSDVLGLPRQEVVSQIYYQESDDFYRTYMTKEEIEKRQASAVSENN